MKRFIIQIYEIQTPEEAETLIRLGVDHIGSVLVSEKSCQEAFSRNPHHTFCADSADRYGR